MSEPTLKSTAQMSVKEQALAELQQEKVAEATAKLKVLYSKLADAEKVVKQIQFEIDEYSASLED